MKYADLKPDKAVGNYQWNHQAHLGSGAFGKVYLAHDKEGSLVAVKVMENKQMNDPYLQKSLQNELEILSTLNGPNVMGLIDYLKTQNRSYIVQKFANQGDLRGVLNQRKMIPEVEALKILQDMLKGFQELASNNLIHRDLKPENTLINDNTYIVADYGFSKKCPDYQNTVLTSQCGTPLYMSPQILQGQPYTTKSDVWSMGIIYYEILFGCHPWQPQTQEQLISLPKTRPLRFKSHPSISQLSRNFIEGCLKYQEADRFSWQQVFEHEIFQSQNVQQVQNEIEVDKETIDIVSQIQQKVSENNLNPYELFQKFNTGENDQHLNIDEFMNFVQAIGIENNVNKVIELMQKHDVNKDGKFSYEEFSNMILKTDYSEVSNHGLLEQQRANRCLKKLKDVVHEQNFDLRYIFQKFDQTQDGQLDINEFLNVLKVIEPQISVNEAQIIFNVFDKDGCASISFEEFHQEINGGKEQEAVEIQFENMSLQDKLSKNALRAIGDLKLQVTQHGLDLLQLFTFFDQDHSRNLNLQEFTKFIKVICARLSPEDINDIFVAFDDDKQGTLSFDEFMKLFK